MKPSGLPNVDVDPWNSVEKISSRIGQNIRAYYPTRALTQDKSDVIRPRRGMTRSAVYSVVHCYQVSSTIVT